MTTTQVPRASGDCSTPPSHRPRPPGTRTPSSTSSMCGPSTTANGDGVGDFRGLIEKLDYLQGLGVTALWLLPFYPSPLRDDGYDISDYRQVHPSYGTLRDFRLFLREAHRRGMRVITELVLAHTSDQHPWFQRARRSRPGSSAPRTSTSGATRPTASPTPGSSSRTSRLRTGRSTRSPAPTTGTASTPISRASTTTTRRSDRRCSTWSTSGSPWASTGSGSTPSRTSTPVRGPRARTCPRPSSSCGRYAPTSTSASRDGCSWPRRTSGPRTLSPTWARATCATWRSTSH